MSKFSLFLFFCFSSLFAQNPHMGVTTLELFDEERKQPVVVELFYPTNVASDANYILEEDPHKMLKDVWLYPTELRDAPISEEKQKYPLLLMSHGSCGFRLEQSWLAEKMVQRGYIVASVEHAGDTFSDRDPQYLCRSWNRPMDVRFTLDFLLSSEPFCARIDKEKIGMVGYSLGGMTGLFLAGGLVKNLKEDLVKNLMGNMPKSLVNKIIANVDWEKTLSSFEDKRIKAYFLLAPAGSIFSAHSLENITAPVHVLYTNGDRTLAPELHAIYVANNIKTANITLVDPNAGHFVFLNEVSDKGKQVLPQWLYEETPGVDREKIFTIVTEQAEQFFAKTL